MKAGCCCFWCLATRLFFDVVKLVFAVFVLQGGALAVVGDTSGAFQCFLES
jgi:hypothetical protein